MHRWFIVLWLVLLWSALPARAQEGPIVTAQVDSRTGTAYGLAWSPNGEWLAVASGYEMMIFSADLSAPLVVIEPGEILNLTWSPDSTHLASVGGLQDPEIRIWAWNAAANTLELETTLDGNAAALGAGVRSRHHYVVAWSSQDIVASLADDRVMRVQLWDPLVPEFETGFEVLYTFPLREFVWSDDGTALIGAAQRPNEEAFVLISMDREGNVSELLDLPTDSAAFTLSPDKTQVAVAAAGGWVTILDLANGEELLRFQSVSEPVGLAWHPDGDRLAVLNYQVEEQDNALELWDVNALHEK